MKFRVVILAVRRRRRSRTTLSHYALALDQGPVLFTPRRNHFPKDPRVEGFGPEARPNTRLPGSASVRFSVGATTLRSSLESRSFGLPNRLDTSGLGNSPSSIAHRTQQIN